MKIYLRNLLPMAAGLFFFVGGAPWANAQVQDTIRAHIDHSFVIDNTTLPPGDYTFRNIQKEDHSVMTAVDTNDRKHTVDFVVRPTMADHTPRHTELVFRKIGNTEFLSKIFESGSKTGMAVTETGKEDAQYKNATEHTEEQKQ